MVESKINSISLLKEKPLIYKTKNGFAMIADEVSHTVKEIIKSYMDVEQYFKLGYQGCSSILDTGNITFPYCILCLEKSFISCRGRRNSLKIHHSEKTCSSNFRFLAWGNYLFFSALWTKIYCTLMLLCILMYRMLKHLMCDCLKRRMVWVKIKTGILCCFLRTQICVFVYSLLSSLISPKNTEGNVIKLCENKRRLLCHKPKSSVQVCFFLNVLWRPRISGENKKLN